METSRYLIEEIHLGMRLTISQDKYNRIVIIGSTKLDEKRFAKESYHGYFTNLKMMIKWLFRQFLRTIFGHLISGMF